MMIFSSQASAPCTFPANLKTSQNQRNQLFFPGFSSLNVLEDPIEAQVFWGHKSGGENGD